MHDRIEEATELAALLDGPGPKLALLYGRRRVGKTFLLNHVWPRSRTFYFVAAETTPAINRREVLDEIARQSGGDDLHEHDPTWRTVFRSLLELNAPEPAVIILDEYQYLRGGEDDVDSQLLAALELYRNSRTSDRPLVLALCGSIVREMRHLDSVGSPLHGRFHWTAHLQPFDYHDAASMAGFENRRDRARSYGIWGGTPSYLAAIDASQTLPENACRTVLSPRGEVRRLTETAIEQEQGLRKTSDYRATLVAIGHGCTTRNEIAQRAGLDNDYGFVTMLETLEKLGYVRGERNFDASSNEPWRYRISDAALRFHYELVNPYRAELETNPAQEVWERVIAGRLDTYMGHVFEAIVREGWLRHRSGLDLPMIAEWGRWEGTDRTGASLEMDVVARLTDGAMLTGAIKWNRHPVSARLHEQHVRDLQRLADAGRKWAHRALDDDAHLVYAAAGGFHDGFRDRVLASDLEVTLWTLEDLYPEPSGATSYRRPPS